MTLNDNRLWGELPDSMTALTRLFLLDFLNNHGLCMPDEVEFQEWLQAIPSEFVQVITCSPPSTTPDAGDQAVLTTLYSVTDGDNWEDNTNWLSEQPLQYWKGVTINSEGRVTELRLGNNQMSGYIPSELGNLSTLELLRLDYNLLTGTIPAVLGNLVSLKTLFLSNNQLTGSIPAELGNLVSLERLYLDENQLNGPIPIELSNLIGLEWLHLDGNQLSGEIPSDLGDLANLLYLDLDGNRLSSNIPAELGNLSSLISLDVHNNQLTGTIPSELGILSHLNRLSLSTNQLTGAIPPELASLNDLSSLSLGTNQLTGAIPRWLGSLDQLGFLSVNDNQLTGSIPPELGNLPYLNILWLHSNQLTGTIPPELSNLLPSLEELLLAGNQLTGCIPTPLRDVGANDFDELGLPFRENADRAALVALYNATDGDNWTNNTNWLTYAPLGEWYGVTTDEDGRVTELDLLFNGLIGRIPPELSQLRDMTRLDLSINLLTGEIPSELGNLAGLEYLDLGFNNLGGTIPQELGNLTNLKYLILRYNRLTETVPSELGNLTQLEVLHTKHNRLWGALPHSLATLTQLRSLQYLENSGLCAPDDAAFQEWLQQVWFEAEETLTCVPESTTPDPQDVAVLTKLYNATGGDNWDDTTNWFSEQPLQYWKGVTINADGRVTELNFDRNNLSGGIPEGLSGLDALEKLTLFGQLTGAIPAELGDLINLKLLNLSGNRFTGGIPSELGSLDNLESLTLSSSELTGSIPSELSNLASLKGLSLSYNQLSGAIPAELGDLTGLVSLNLHNNQLSGAVPAELGDLTGLASLSLHNNHLTGAIPSEFGNLVNLTWFDLGDNELTGSIPSALSSLTALTNLHLSRNQLSGEIPSELGSLDRLGTLLLNHNQLTGTIPPEIGNPTGLWHVGLAGNRLTGCIPQTLSDVSNHDFDELGLAFCTDTQPGPDPTPESPECLESLPDGMTVNDAWDTGCTSSISAPGGNGDRYARYYTFIIDAESDVTIGLSSVEDTFLYLREGAGRDSDVLHENDVVVSGNTNSRIQQTLSAGTYTIEATTYNAGVTGEFTLTVSGLPSVAGPEPTPESPADGCVETIGVDGIVSGSWNGECVSGSRSGSYANYYTFTLAENSEVAITLESSVDTYLYLRQGAGRDGSVLYENDDILLGSDTNSRLSVTLQPGDYTIEATTYYAQTSGDFTLTIAGLGSSE